MSRLEELKNALNDRRIERVIYEMDKKKLVLHLGRVEKHLEYLDQRIEKIEEEIGDLVAGGAA